VSTTARNRRIFAWLKTGFELRVNRWDLPGGRREADRFNGLPTSPNCDEVRNE
jgi:hypothetical protein